MAMLATNLFAGGFFMVRKQPNPFIKKKGIVHQSLIYNIFQFFKENTNIIVEFVEEFSRRI